MNSDLRQLLFLQELLGQSASSEVWIRNSLQSLSIHWDEKLANTLYSHALSNPDCLSNLISPFTLPFCQAEILGQLDLGKVSGREDIRFSIPIDRLPMHILVAGSSGFGKTVFGLCLAEQAYLRGVNSVRIVDPKADEYIKLARKHLDFLVLKWSELRFNPLTPPPNVPRIEWHQVIVGHIAQNFNFWQGGEALLISQLDKLTRN